MVEDEVTGMVLTLIVPVDQAEEEGSEPEQGSFGDLDQGMVLDESSAIE